jgi:hypothetical protein
MHVLRQERLTDRPLPPLLPLLDALLYARLVRSGVCAHEWVCLEYA